MSRSALSAHATILVVEDEPALRETLVEAFAEAGYRVVEAGCGEAALALLRERRGEIDLLFTDIRLPGLIDGWRVADEFRMSAPLSPVVYATGGDPQAPRPVAGSAFLRKPYRPADVLGAMAQLEADLLLAATPRRRSA